MLIRIASSEDVSQVVLLAQEMVKDTPFSEVKREKIEQIIAIPRALSLVAETEDKKIVGFFCGLLDRQFFTDQIRAIDLALFVKEEYRGSSASVKFIKKFEQWAKQKGATQIWLGQSVGHNIEQTKNFYERLGYKTMGVNTLKDI
jgi:GNAT superfamily N-acetyltransferase